MSRLWNLKTLLFKTEVTYGVDSVPTGTADAIQALNVTFNPQAGNDVARGLQRPFLGADGTLPAGMHSTLAFDVELAPSGTAGTAPAWGPLLLACGVAQVVTPGVSVAYSPASAAHASATIYFNLDGTRHLMRGVRGNAKFMLEANQTPKIRFEFMGLLGTPSAVANPALTLTPWQVPQVVSDANTPTVTFNAVDLITRSIEFDLGNQVVPRLLINSDSIVIPQRSERIAAVVESVPLATLNPFALALSATTAAMSVVHGTGAGRIATLAVPRAQIQRVTGVNEQDGFMEWPLTFVPIPTATGNDQWTLTLT